VRHVEVFTDLAGTPLGVAESQRRGCDHGLGGLVGHGVDLVQAAFEVPGELAARLGQPLGKDAQLAEHLV
jgi:hypothetical protein